jgi:raffinose/stachyose/melibiose transport system substrate-binding protein
MASACKGENGGFAGPEIVKAWKMYKQLCNLDPFQEGFQTTKAREAASSFHDGKAAFHLQAGAWVLTVGRLYSADKQGLPDAKLGWLFSPEVQGGKGKANDILAPSTAGWFQRMRPKRRSIL